MALLPEAIRAGEQQTARHTLQDGTAVIVQRITGREGPPIRGYVLDAATIAIRAEDTKEDIRKFIDWKMSSQHHDLLNSNDKLARGVKQALNDRAHLMYVLVP